MVLLPPPVAKATKEIVGEEPVYGITDNVDINRLVYSEPDKKRKVDYDKLQPLRYQTIDKFVYATAPLHHTW